MRYLLLLFVLFCPAIGQVSHADSTDTTKWLKEPKEFRSAPFNCSFKVFHSKIATADCITDNPNDVFCKEDFKIGKCDCSAFCEIVDDKFVCVLGTFKPDDFDYLKDVFTDKFGSPQSTEKEILITRMGVEYENEKLAWDGDSIIIYLDKYSKSIDESRFDFYVKAYFHAATDKHLKDKEKAKNDF